MAMIRNNLVERFYFYFFLIGHFQEKKTDSHICVLTYMHKLNHISKQEEKKRKKGIKFLTLSEMNNQKAHTEADKEKGGTV